MILISQSSFAAFYFVVRIAHTEKFLNKSRPISIFAEIEHHILPKQNE